ncbi:hypothetical protein FO510_05875 [Bacillus pumilus]|uniref:hypothetical protein n=1 Tax=Bacillus pumilus TaxID=1408 RepID=UPI00017A5E5C|nr:hypothetical protein [Bacillus pumilus]EDW22606.1 hypothetical protein BAT_0061 [Bacillus pumilus ATCC 7061]MBB6600735.1 hypothetical protein [Bacillus pumilus]MCR4352102.1 hypothetical protein [Bacillus pumilus]MCY7506362.1 hypothetical protein [Bacillus pumilus]MDH3174857.1 hypothetical protein [Bacillus pumilus]
MNIDPRQAFRDFIRYQLENGEGLTELGLNEEDIEKFLYGAEDDMLFHAKLDEFLKEYIEDFGQNYGIDIPLEE